MFLPIVLFIISEIVGIHCHGRMHDPAARNAMWRFGFKNPPNYNDNELFCGGLHALHTKNKGKCGVCGDDYSKPVPRDHEDGGKYGNGIIVKSYKVGQQIPINVSLSANHKGYMETKICPTPVTQECLDSNPLKIVGQNTSIYNLPSHMPGVFSWNVQLPESMTCSRCVIQWKYTAGNNWGICKDRQGRVGCGPQETFVNCADVEILP